MASMQKAAAASGLLLRVVGAVGSRPTDLCPGKFNMPGYGPVYMIPTGWADEGFETVDVSSKGELVTHMDARAYFADDCTPGEYDHKQYLALKLLGKTMRYTMDLSGAGCGCNAAFYLTSMQQNTQPSECSDFYCDANNVCGESCAEIDIQEANQFAWHSTLHTATDHSGVGGGYGGGDSWNGPRDWGSAEYGPGGSCIDTEKPFDVAVSFPVDGQGTLSAMEVTLTQDGKSCPLSVRLGTYEGMGELSQALEAGMTPIVSYWAANDMLWMDGTGTDGQGPCSADDMDACAKTVKFYDFTLSDVGEAAPVAGSNVQESSGNRPPEGITAASGYNNPASTPATSSSLQTGSLPTPAPATATASTGSSGDFSQCAASQKEDCRNAKCCKDPGMQCYEKNEYWGACKETCVPGSTDPEDTGEHRTPWSCQKVGARTPKGGSSSASSSVSSTGVGSSQTGSSGSQSTAAGATATKRPDGKVTVKVTADGSFPDLEEGKEVKLSWGSKEFDAVVLEEALVE